ncbi:succinyl-diaminopimelate desuccinylase [Sphingopyxis terrae]|uniref:Succinyl-diaminopimelate desuccinylase n=1 Tax=Sphingopyxis terrae subsp. ummariensis TaxID=429001 RepID=A0A1Y6EXY7_9SPHN|nr:succinyl-diaminopimelate desuccinylase [Sphingopyxis terrae]PCF92236.1 succinyl-diaminopimelate desuccinylase [Sphingopyxis terrae subsp. ummariensis]SMQ66121.1 succinyldiaminopimelate desuccinylase [Sphingopyxis terrae subsp. ummariensis]
MTMTIDPVDLARALIAAPSVTPATGAVFDVLEAALAPLGFTVERFIDGIEPDGPVENLLAIRAGSGPIHFGFAGHLDVVPPGVGWTGDAFAPEIRGDLLYGRGAVDMKGSIAAFVAAAAATPADAGTVSLIITGDEEGPAIFGTRALMEHMDARGVKPDMIVVGEPTSVNRLGDMVKIGRRGSVNIWIDVPGTQGHVAYPHLADNPIPKLVRILAAIDTVTLDEGTAWFQPSNIEFTDLEVGNGATNVIPASARARLSIRFNDQQKGADLVAMVERIAQDVEPAAKVIGKISGEAFLTPPGALSSLVAEAIRAETGIEADMSTTGGTSDARFLHALCPVVEFGPTNATMHKLDEAVAVEDLHTLTAIYRGILDRAFR